MEEGKDKLNGQTFYIVNKKYNQTRIAQWGTGGRDMGTYGGEYFPDQLWELRANDNHPGYYYIVNCHHSLYRIGKWGSGDASVGAYIGDWYDDQLWRFDKQSDGFYYIYNKEYPDARIAKWGHGDGQWGTYAGDKYEDQLWKLVPRFNANMGFTVVWEADNRQGTEPFSQKVKITRGFKNTTTQKIKVEVGMKYSAKASASAGLEGIGEASSEIGTEYTASLAAEFTGSHQFSAQVEIETTFSAPPGKHYKVLAMQGQFEDKLGDSFEYKGTSFKIVQTD